MTPRRLFTFCLLVSIALSLQSQQPAPGKDSTSTAADSIKVDSVEILKKELKSTNKSIVEITSRIDKKIQMIPSRIENAVLMAQYRKRMAIVASELTPIKPEPELPPISVDSAIKKKTNHGLFKFLRKKQ